MKKIISVISSGIIFLTGCSNQSVVSDTEEVVTDNKSTTIAPEQANVMDYNKPYFIARYCNIHENGLIYKKSDIIRYMNLDTMQDTVLCAKPNCTHKNSDCIAKIIQGTPVIYNNYIYYFDSKEGVNETPDGYEFYINSKLKKVSMETSEIEVVTEFTDCEPDQHGKDFVIDGNMLYFCGNDMNPTQNEFGGIDYASAGGKFSVCSINLDTGEYTNYGNIYDNTLYSGMSQSAGANLIGCYNSKLYIEYSFMKEYSDSFENVDPRELFTVMNFEFDLQTHEIREADLPSGSHMGDDFYVYSNYPEISSTVLVGDEKYTIPDADVETFGKYFDGKLFILDKWYDVKDGSCHDLGSKYAEWKILTKYGDYYIFADMFNSDFIKLTEEELLSL